MSPETQRLIASYIIKQAEQFLLEFEGFFPFAAVINYAGEIVPMGAELDNEENPSAHDIILLFEQALKTQFQQKEIVYAAICADVSVEAPHLVGEMDALEIRCQSITKESVNVYVPYYRDYKKNIIFLEPYEEEGNLDLLD